MNSSQRYTKVEYL